MHPSKLVLPVLSGLYSLGGRLFGSQQVSKASKWIIGLLAKLLIDLVFVFYWYGRLIRGAMTVPRFFGPVKKSRDRVPICCSSPMWQFL